jgi:hypothetical protein
VLLELLLRRRQGGTRSAVQRLLVCVVVAAGVFVGLLAILDQVAPPYDSSNGAVVGGGVFGHISHIFSFSAEQTNPHGPTGIQSYPWQWLGDFRPIVYLNVNPAQPAPGLKHVHPPVHFLGMTSPPILLAALIGLLVAIRELWRVRGRRRRSAGRSPDELPELALAWTAGTLGPFEVLSAALHRTSYLYYMVIVMPGLCAAAADLAARLRRRGRWVWLVRVWAVTVVGALVVMYPLTPLP